MTSSKRYKQIELAQLRSYCLAALQGSFTAAAKHLGLSVTTVWQQVRALERRLGSRLLEVQGRTLQVTPEGRLLLELVQPHVSSLDSLERLFQGRRTELPQHLTLASTFYLFAYHLPRPLRAFAAEYPSIRLNLRAGLWPEVTQRVESGEADLGVVSCTLDAWRSPHLRYEPLFHLHFTLLTAAGHPLTRRRRIRPQDLVAYPLIVAPRETFSYQTLEHILRRHDLMEQIHIVMESPNTEVLRTYVASGLGIALTYMGGEAPLPGLAQRRVDAKLEPLPVFAVTRKDAHLPEAGENFRRLLPRFLADGRTDL